MGSGLPWDVCNRNTCRAWGDPHVDGFDGNRNDVYGGAIYSLSETTGRGFTEMVQSSLELRTGTICNGSWSVNLWLRLF